jgi:hypothetical protein
MFLLHCHASAAVADKLHRCQFVFALMGVIRFGGSTETAFLFITARIAQVTGFVGNRSATFTRIRHHKPPMISILGELKVADFS